MSDAMKCGTFMDPADMAEEDAYAVSKFRDFLSFAGPPGSTPLPDECFTDPEWREFLGLDADLAGWTLFVRWACGIRRPMPDEGSTDG